MTPRIYEWLRCLDCGHIWDDLNPDHEVCDCFYRLGRRRSEWLGSGATNMPPTLRMAA